MCNPSFPESPGNFVSQNSCYFRALGVGNDQILFTLPITAYSWALGMFVPWEHVTTHILVLADLNTTWDLILWLSQSQEAVVDILFHPMLKIILQLLPFGTSFKNF